VGIVDVAIAAAATWQAVEIFHHGEIFAFTRAWLETEQSDRGGFWRSILTWFCDLLLCPFCLSVWVGFILAAWLWLATGTMWGLPIYGLAVSRLANLANDVTGEISRTPK